MFKFFRQKLLRIRCSQDLVYACVGITDSNILTSYKGVRFLLFPRDFVNLPNGLPHIPALTCVWNKPKSIEFPYSTF